MLYSLDVYVTCNNAGIRTAITNVLPLASDPIVDDSHGLYQGLTTFEDDNGDTVLSAMIRFHTENDRLGILNALKGLSGMFTQCIIPSKVTEHKCYNHPDEPVKLPCEVTSVWEKT